MSRILYADFARLKKSKVFLSACVLMILYAVFVCGYTLCLTHLGNALTFESLFFNGYGAGGQLALPGILMAIVCNLFVGTDFSNGTVRNKVIVGHTRREIYLSNFIVCALSGILLNAIYIVCICVLGIWWIDSIKIPAPVFMLLALDGVLMYIAYGAVFNMLAMMIKNKTTASIISLIMVFIAMLISMYLMMRIAEPEFCVPDVMTMVNGETVDEQWIKNPEYLNEKAKRICQLLIDFIPTGQSIQISHFTVSNPWSMLVYSLIIIVVTNITGVISFQKTDLK